MKKPIPMGISENEFTFSSKTPWTIEGTFPTGNIQKIFVRVNQNKESNKITTTIHDSGNDILKNLYEVIGYYYKLGFEKQPEELELGKLKLTLWNSVEEIIETRDYDGVCPISVCFCDLDHSSCDGTCIEIDWKYSSKVQELKDPFPEPSTSL